MTGAGVGALHHAVVTTRDFEAAVAFFVDVLGMTRGTDAVLRGPGITRLVGLPEGATGRQVFLTGPGSAGQVEVVEWDQPGEPVRRRLVDPGLSLISFGVSPAAFEAVLDRARAAGVEVLAGPEVLDVPEYAPTRLVLLRGPEDIPVELMCAAEEAR